MHYRTNHATFELPPELKDKTMHVFTLNPDGPSDFNVVISHAEAQPDDTLEQFGERLVKELEKALPLFHWAESERRVVDGGPALELAYSWFSEGKYLHQRQVIILMPGNEPDTVQAMLIGATCLRAFSKQWNAAFDALLDSIKLRRPPGGPDAQADALPTVFALSERRRTLYAFADQDEACRKIDAREVEKDAWAFFDAAGTPLHARFVVPNSGTLWRSGGAYVLEARPAQAAIPLSECIAQAALFVPGGPDVPFATIADVQAHLAQSARS